MLKGTTDMIVIAVVANHHSLLTTEHDDHNSGDLSIDGGEAV